jgi:Xaa-Pro aminopeptidase
VSTVKRVVGLERIGVPELLVPEEQPQLPAAEYERRLAALRGLVSADAIVVYADREHFANVSFLCGFDPRFEEALLVLADGRPTLIAGTESLALAALLPIDANVLHCPSLGLMGQDREQGLRVADALAEAGVRPGGSVAVAGWKSFEPGELGPTGTPIAAPAFLVDTIRELVGCGGALADATGVLTNPVDGLRTTVGADQIAAFEWAAARAARAVFAIVGAAEPGRSEREAVAAMPFAGEPLSAHVMFASGPEVAAGLRSPTGRRLERGDAATTAVGFWGGLCCRAGLLEEAPPKAGGHGAEYLERMAIPYWTAIAAWYEAVGLGTPGGEIDRRVRELLAGAGFGPALNPGHLTHLDEWVHSPVRPGSQDPIRSGMCLQCDIIPDSTRPGWAANCEDTVAVADSGLRSELAERHPELWSRVQTRRELMRARLGIDLAEEVLPLSAAPAYFPPFWMSPERALASR